MPWFSTSDQTDRSRAVSASCWLWALGRSAQVAEASLAGGPDDARIDALLVACDGPLPRAIPRRLEELPIDDLHERHDPGFRRMAGSMGQSAPATAGYIAAGPPQRLSVNERGRLRNDYAIMQAILKYVV